MQPPPHHATFEGYHTSPFAPIPLNSSLGCIWCAPDSIVLYMATTFGRNHLNRSLLCHHPKMSSLFCRLCLISERISPLYPSNSALTAFNTLDLSSLMGRRTRGATCGRWHHPNLKRRVCPGTLARTCKSTSWDQCSIFSNQKTPSSSFGTSLSDAKRRSRSLDANVVQRSGQFLAITFEFLVFWAHRRNFSTMAFSVAFTRRFFRTASPDMSAKKMQRKPVSRNLMGRTLP